MLQINRRDVEQLRGPKRSLLPNQPFDVVTEFESDEDRKPVSVLAVFLTGAECSFRCTFCDLWQYTLDIPTPRGALVEQLELALNRYPKTDWIKLYNASNFFDPRCVPPDDVPAIAMLCKSYSRIIVENHPKWTRPSILEFRDQLTGRLEIAMGLETVEPSAIKLLNKEFNLDEFRNAADWLRDHEVDLRCFVLLQPPGTPPEASVDGVVEAVAFANICGARHVSIIPTRGGNGVMEQLQSQGLYVPPSAGKLEQSFAACLSTFQQMLISVDLWNWQHLSGHCLRCSEPRRCRLEEMNLCQSVLSMPMNECNCVL